jgi:hypothetical protein
MTVPLLPGPRPAVLATLAVVAGVAAAACGAPVGNNGKPVGMELFGSRLVIVVPLCPGERIASLNVVGDGYEWDVSTPLNPRATEIDLGDDAAFRYVRKNTIPLGGAREAPGSGDVLVSVSTSMDTHQRYRFQNAFHLPSVGTELNGGRAFDDQTVGRTVLQKASNC